MENMSSMSTFERICRDPNPNIGEEISKISDPFERSIVEMQLAVFLRAFQDTRKGNSLDNAQKIEQQIEVGDPEKLIELFAGEEVAGTPVRMYTVECIAEKNPGKDYGKIRRVVSGAFQKRGSDAKYLLTDNVRSYLR